MATLLIVEITVFDGEEDRVVRSLERMAGVLAVTRLDQPEGGCTAHAHGEHDWQDDVCDDCGATRSRCEADALRGTGFGVCGHVLDQHGECPRASRHVGTLTR